MRALRILAAAALAVGVAAAPAHAETVSYTASMSAAEEVPNKGPEGAMGTATVNINTDTNQVCYRLALEGLSETPSAGHIHQGQKGVAGGVVIDFNLPANGLDSCVTADAAKVAAVVADPGGHYVNIHTPSYPAGAMRGQLGEVTTMAPAQPQTQPATQPPAESALPRTGVEGLLAAAGGALIAVGTATRATARRTARR